jgi:diadenosine tetraphosphate (Ap4A) HIT family hydrolase
MTWKNPEKWEKMISGEDCDFCRDIHMEENKHSYLVSELKSSFVRFPKNQYCKGWTIVALKRHATELFELTLEERADFMEDIASVAKAVKELVQAVKINYAIYGNLCSHLHCHILPQQIENDPNAPIKMNAEEVFLSEDEYKTIIKELREKIEG